MSMGRKWASGMPETRLCKGVGGHPPPENFEKLDCVRLQFVRSKGSMLQNQVAKSDTGNNPSSPFIDSMASKRITFLSQFCLTFF